MKILYVHTFAERKGHGGAEETLWTLMCAMRDAGHQCVLLATTDQHGLRRSEQDGITVWKAGIRNFYWPDLRKHHQSFARAAWHLQDSYNPWMQSYVRKVVRVEQPDVASLHNLPGWSAATWTTLNYLRIPTVQVLHDHYLICPRSTMFRNASNCTGQCRSCAALRLPHRALSRRLAAVVGVSRYILEAHLRLGYFRGVPIQRAIHNVRNIETLDRGNVADTIARPGVRFGYIGTLAASKGVSKLIDAFLKAAIPDSELWIAGSGRPEYERRLRIAAASNVRIRFLGRVTPNSFYPNIDVLIVPSLWREPLGMVVAEAFAFGKPVIGSTRGGIPEMIVNDHNGILFDPGRPGELASQLRRVAVDPASRRRMGDAARVLVQPFLDLARFTASYEELYREAILESLGQHHNVTTPQEPSRGVGGAKPVTNEASVANRGTRGK